MASHDHEEVDTHLYATYVEDGSERKLVVIESTDAATAQRESGLIEYQFHPAAEAELEEWEAVCARPLTVRDLDQLAYLVRRAQRDLASRRRRRADAHPNDLFRARKLAQVYGKLTLLADETDDQEEDEWPA